MLDFLISLIPFVDGGVVFLLSYGLFRWLNSSVLKSGGVREEDSARTQRAMLQWGVSAVCVCTAILGNVVIASWIISQTIKPYDKMTTIAVLSVIAFAMSFGSIRLYRFEATGRTGAALIDSAGAATGVPLRTIVYILNALAYSWMVLAAASLCLLAARPGELNADIVAERIKFAWISLAGTAALFPVALMEILALIRLGVAASARSAASLSVDPESIVWAAGVWYSLLLIVSYAPVVILHDVWLDAVIRSELVTNPDLDVTKWLSAHGLGASSGTAIGRAVAILTPPVVGFLARFVIMADDQRKSSLT